MSAEQNTGRPAEPTPPRDNSPPETLTDLIDRMDREAFRRALAQRDVRVVSYRIRRQP
jgi:hypothetical protein